MAAATHPPARRLHADTRPTNHARFATIVYYTATPCPPMLSTVDATAQLA